MPPKKAASRKPKAAAPAVPFQTALSGVSSGLHTSDWREAFEPFSPNEAPPLALYALPQSLHCLTLEDAAPNKFLDHAADTWAKQDQQQRTLEGAGADEGKFVKVEWFCLKRFLYEKLLAMRPVTYSLARLVVDPSQEVTLQSLLAPVRQWLDEVYDFEINIVAGSWVGTLLKDFVGPDLGSSDTYFLVWLLHPSLQLRLLSTLRSAVRWDRLPEIESDLDKVRRDSRSSTASADTEASASDMLSSFRSACLDGDARRIFRLLRKSYFGLPRFYRLPFADMDLKIYLPALGGCRRIIVGPQGDIRATYLRRHRTVVISPLSLGPHVRDATGQISVDLHDDICDLVIHALTRADFRATDVSQVYKHVRSDLAALNVQFTMCRLPDPKRIRQSGDPEGRRGSEIVVGEPLLVPKRERPSVISNPSDHQPGYRPQASQRGLHHGGKFANSSHLGRLSTTVESAGSLLIDFNRLRDLMVALTRTTSM